MERKPKVLLVDVDVRTRKICQEAAGSIGCEILTTNNTAEALSEVDREEIGIVLLDTKMDHDPLEMLQQIRTKSARVEVVILDDQATVPKAVRAVKAGALDYLEKPLELEIVERSISDGLERYSRFEPSVAPLNELEKRAIEHALVQADGDKIEAARLLSIGKTTLYRKLKEYGHHTPRHRNVKPYLETPSV